MGRFAIPLFGLIGALVAALVLAAPSSALGPNIIVRVAKDKDGPYREILSVNVAKNQTKNLWYRVRSESETDLKDLLFDDGLQKYLETLRVKWFEGGDNVTHDVQTSGHEFNLKADASKYFNARVTAEKKNVEECLIGRAVYPSVSLDQAFAGINDDCAP
jgi:hypothetical protein